MFLHGYLSSKESFYPQINYFSRRFRVTAPDLPRIRGERSIPAAWSVGEYADWLEGFLKERGIAFPCVIAHSFGGRVAIKCLARGLIDRAVLTGCAGIVKRRTLSYHIKVKSYRLVKKVLPRALRKQSSGARNTARFPRSCGRVIKRSSRRSQGGGKAHRAARALSERGA